MSNNPDCGCGCRHCDNRGCANRVPIFAGLSQQELDQVTRLIVRKQYQKGEMIFMEGNRLAGLIIINAGQVKVFRYTSEGKEQILHLFSPGDFLGEKNLLKDRQATYYAQALTDVGLCLIYRDAFRQLLLRHPEIGLKVIEELCGRLERLEDAVQGLGTKSIESRISAVLLEFAERYGIREENGLLVELPLSREGIANYIGVTRETVSRKLSLLHEEGIIRMIGNKKLLIPDMEKLRQSQF